MKIILAVICLSLYIFKEEIYQQVSELKLCNEVFLDNLPVCHQVNNTGRDSLKSVGSQLHSHMANGPRTLHCIQLS